jgi:8-oxo-dGTP pyrophosphatase MutT (NUDIX family)
MAHEERSAGFIAFATRGVLPAAPLPAQRKPDDLRYLLLDYGRHWDFPKGHVEYGEDDLTAAVRELAEETGFEDPQVVPGFRHEIVYFFRHRKRGLVRKSVVFFLARLSSEKVVLSPEHVGYAFLPIEPALKRVTFATAREVLRRAHAHLIPVHPAAGASGATECHRSSSSELPSLFDPPPARL